MAIELSNETFTNQADVAPRLEWKRYPILASLILWLATTESLAWALEVNTAFLTPAPLIPPKVTT